LPPKSIMKEVYLKIQTPLRVDWQIQGGRIQTLDSPSDSIQFFCLKPDDPADTIVLSPTPSNERGQPHG
jgi:hypothetical protein